MVIPDSSNNTIRILFGSKRDNVNGGNAGFELYAMNLDGSALTQLTHNSVFDGYSEDAYEPIESGSLARGRQERHQPRAMMAPLQRFRW